MASTAGAGAGAGASAVAAKASTTKPADFLKGVLGRPVVVKLNSGVDYRGTGAVSTPNARHKHTPHTIPVRTTQASWLA